MPAPPDTSFEREKWVTDVRLREEELAIRDREAAVKEKDQARSRWTNPLVIAIAAAAAGAIGNAVVAYINGTANYRLEGTRNSDLRAIESLKAESALILEAVKTDSDPDKAAENLRVLLEAGLIENPERRQKLADYLDHRATGTGLALPSANQPAVDPKRPITGPKDKVNSICRLPEPLDRETLKATLITWVEGRSTKHLVSNVAELTSIDAVSREPDPDFAVRVIAAEGDPKNAVVVTLNIYPPDLERMATEGVSAFVERTSSELADTLTDAAGVEVACVLTDDDPPASPR
jgi:hypothetical protein